MYKLYPSPNCMIKCTPRCLATYNIIHSSILFPVNLGVLITVWQVDWLLQQGWRYRPRHTVLPQGSHPQWPASHLLSVQSGGRPRHRGWSRPGLDTHLKPQCQEVSATFDTQPLLHHSLWRSYKFTIRDISTDSITKDSTTPIKQQLYRYKL